MGVWDDCCTRARQVLEKDENGEKWQQLSVDNDTKNCWIRQEKERKGRKTRTVLSTVHGLAIRGLFGERNGCHEVCPCVTAVCQNYPRWPTI